MGSQACIQNNGGLEKKSGQRGVGLFWVLG